MWYLCLFHIQVYVIFMLYNMIWIFEQIFSTIRIYGLKKGEQILTHFQSESECSMYNFYRYLFSDGIY